MKNDLTCGVVRDLLPSYADGLVSEESREAVERHMETCTDCREALRQMQEPADTSTEQTHEIDYLKKVRQKSRKRMVLPLLAAVLLVSAVLFRICYIGFPLGPSATAAVVSVRDGTVRVTGMLTDSGQSVSRAVFRESGDGTVDIQLYAAPPIFGGSGDFTWEYPAAGEVSRVTINGLVLWEDGEAIDMLAARLYAAKNPYVGDMSANASIAAILRVANRVGSFTNELQTDAEPYGWTLVLDDPVAAEHEPGMKDEMRRCSCVLLTEIENLGSVAWRYKTAAGEQSFSVTAADASRIAGRDIKSFAGSAAELQSLLELLGI